MMGSHIWSILNRQSGFELGTYNLPADISEEALRRIGAVWVGTVVLWNHTTGEVFYQ